MTVSASAEDAGKIEALLQINGPDGPGRIAIKGSYLSDYLAGKEGIVMMGTSSTSSPALLNYRSSPTIVLMSMQTQWGDEKPPEKPKAENPAETKEAEQPAESVDTEQPEESKGTGRIRSNRVKYFTGEGSLSRLPSRERKAV